VYKLPERAAAGGGVAQQRHRPSAIPIERPVWFHTNVELRPARFTCIQACGKVDASVVPRLRRQQGPTASLRPGLQPWELPSTAGPAARDQALDPDNDSGEIDQDWGKGCSPRPAGYLPVGGGGSAPEVVPGHPVCDRPLAPSDASFRMTASLTLPSRLGVHRSTISSRRHFAPPAAQLCGVYITTGPRHAAKVSSGSKTEPISTSFTRTSPQPAQIMNSNGKSRIKRTS